MRGGVLRALLAATAVGCLVLVGVQVFVVPPLRARLPRAPVKDADHAVLHRYCSGTDSTPAREGDAPDGAVSLTGVVVAIRHGDRSPINLMSRGAAASGEPAATPFVHLERGAVALRQRLASFVLKVVDSTGAPVAPGDQLGDVLDPATAFSASDLALPPGQLTTRGFAQLFRLGERLREAYSPLVRRLGPEGGADLYVRATAYRRTVLSAAGLVAGLLPQLGVRAVTVHVNEDEGAEVMHGVGLLPGAGEPEPCAAAVQGRGSQREAFRLDARLREELTGLMGAEDVERMSIPELADVVIPSVCHGQPLPCPAGGCFDVPTVAAMKREGDRYYCDRYAGAEGGRRATRVSLYPLMSEISGRLAAMAEGRGARLAVLSGHDTVIAPLLSSLGVRASCGWPPYASRVALELWSGGGEPAHYVRVLFNGDVVTDQVTGCSTAARPGLPPGRARAELCPLEAFRAAVEGLLSPHTSLKAACDAGAQR